MRVAVNPAREMDISDLLRSRPTMIRGELAHSYLENRLLRVSEGTAAAMLREDPQMVAEMQAMLAEMEETFVDGYDPSAFVAGLSSLRQLEAGLRQRLFDAVRREYAARFRPEERLAALQRAGGAFLESVDAWHGHVTRSGVGQELSALWSDLRERARELLALLRDPALRTRWIP